MSVCGIVNTILNQSKHEVLFLCGDHSVKIKNRGVHLGGNFGEDTLKEIISLWIYPGVYDIPNKNDAASTRYMNIANLVKQKSIIHRDTLEQIIENLFDLGYNVEYIK